MTLAMTVEERERFLADVHVGIISVARDDRAPLAVPVWYLYEPGGDVVVITGRESVKATLLRAAGRFSLCAQTEDLPYRYVSVEGPVTETDGAPDGDERRALVYRYLPGEMGDAYLRSTETEAQSSVAFRMRPEQWLTVDYGKMARPG